jgi:hypothetical protein
MAALENFRRRAGFDRITIKRLAAVATLRFVEA